MKLFRVTLRGNDLSCVGTCYGISYVVAESMDEAYKTVRDFLDKRDLGFSHDRELDKIELIADTKEYGDCGCILYIANSGGR